MITKNYIKMCEKAEEIQKEWKFDQEKDNYVKNTKGLRLLTWLPTQEQLQEIILPIFIRRYSTTHALRNDSSFIYRMIIEKFQRWINRSSPSFDEYMAMFNSMNELWLAFVMKEKYKKTWDGKKWK